jgi:endonuclease YncB( thermonuclease family)
MTSSTAVLEPDAPPTARPALDAPDRAPLREKVRAEIARARPRPVAQRTLELLAEAALEPCADGPGYRVVDRHGIARERTGVAHPGPMTLADLVGELRASHPALFLAPEPQPEPAPAESRESALAAGAAEMRAATARFVGAQSERARSLAERSSVQGRALAQSAAGALASFRASLNRGPAAAPEDGAPSGAQPGAQSRVESWAPEGGRFRETLAERLRDLRDRLGGSQDEAGLHRRWLAGAAAAALLAVAGAGIVTVLRAPAPSGTTAPEPAARPAAVPDTVTPPPESDGRSDPEAEAAPPPPNAVTGPVQVIDTATLRVGGKVVHLFGVEWVRGGQAEELARYIAGRAVVCQPAPGSENMNCVVEGRDLSEVVLYNGGGRASPEASPELVAAEEHARSERLGVWKR